MAIMKVKINGAWVELPALEGKKGAKGDKGEKGATGKGFTDEQIDLLGNLLDLVTFSDSTAGKTAVNSLLASLRGTASTDPYTNLVPSSIDTTGAIFNGTGYQNDVRIGSSGALSTSGAAHTTATGFIKVAGGDIVRMANCSCEVANNANAIGVYNTSFTVIGVSSNGGTNNGIFSGSYSDYNYSSVVKEDNGTYKWIVPPAESGVAYIRVSCLGSNSTAPVENLIVTINQEIV